MIFSQEINFQDFPYLFDNDPSQIMSDEYQWTKDILGSGTSARFPTLPL
jgi:hypothetical protein